MKISNSTTNSAGIFAEKIYDLLVENFPLTFYVGGCVRDMLLKIKSTDIDIATEAKPQEVIKILKAHGIKYGEEGLGFGVVSAHRPGLTLEIATFRTEKYGKSRYPKIKFTLNPKLDAKRRDFTVNALYFKPKTAKILDGIGGLGDLRSRTIRFIGNPKKRISEDPLRIIRAFRFCLDLNFHMHKDTWLGVKNNFSLTKNLTKQKIENEIRKSKRESTRKLLEKIIKDGKMLDKYAKKFYSKHDGRGTTRNEKAA